MEQEGHSSEDLNFGKWLKKIYPYALDQCFSSEGPQAMTLDTGVRYATGLQKYFTSL